MNDDFLYRVRPVLRPKFAAELYERISKPAESRSLLERLLKLRLSRPVLQGALVLLLVLVSTLVAYQPARATVLHWLREVAGFLFDEGGESPIPEDWSQVTIGYPTPLGLEQAQSQLPFELRLPTYIPENFATDSQVIASGNWALTGWYTNQTNQGEAIILLVQPVESYPDWAQPVGEGSLEEITVNGQPGALIRGQWFGDQWQEDCGLTLKWQQDDLVYTLSWFAATSRGEPQSVLPLEELLHMAESIP